MNCFRKACAFLLTLMLSGCVFVNGGSVEVIEKSKETTPDWITQVSESGFASDHAIVFVAMKSHIANLPLGAKESQLTTLNASESSLRTRVTKSLMALADRNGISVANVSQFDATIASQVQQVHGKHGTVSDIYYEKLLDTDREDLGEYYRVYVRVDFPKERLTDLFLSIGTAFKKSGSSDLRRLGEKVIPTKQGVSDLLGH